MQKTSESEITNTQLAKHFMWLLIFGILLLIVVLIMAFMCIKIGDMKNKAERTSLEMFENRSPDDKTSPMKADYPTSKPPPINAENFEEYEPYIIPEFPIQVPANLTFKFLNVFRNGYILLRTSESESDLVSLKISVFEAEIYNPLEKFFEVRELRDVTNLNSIQNDMKLFCPRLEFKPKWALRIKWSFLLKIAKTSESRELQNFDSNKFEVTLVRSQSNSTFAIFSYAQLNDGVSLNGIVKMVKLAITLQRSKTDIQNANFGVDSTSIESLVNGSNYGQSGKWIFPFNDYCSNSNN